jgi:ABC-type uncharacterized transport system permease subunit
MDPERLPREFRACFYPVAEGSWPVGVTFSWLLLTLGVHPVVSIVLPLIAVTSGMAWSLCVWAGEHVPPEDA